MTALVISLLSVYVHMSAQYRDLTPQEIVDRDPQSFIYEGKYTFAPALYYSCDISKSETIDESILRVTYEALIIQDTSSSVRYRDRMVTLIGQTWYTSYGEGQWIGNMRHSIPIGDQERELYEREKGYEVIFNISVYRNILERKVINRGQLPEMKDIVFIYDEPQPDFRWVLSMERKDIEGYMCQKAVTRYAGREWTVWFTPEIPVDCGLWKFSGLPGLILEACDDVREYIFTASSIEQKEEPIYICTVHRKKD